MRSASAFEDVTFGRRPPTPKQADRSDAVFPYYAGYADAFVASMIDALTTVDAGVVLDPWNGAGTTTLQASRRGIKSQGLDLNPVAVIAAKASLLSSDVAPSIPALCDEILSGFHDASPPADNDPLLEWLAIAGAGHLRTLERTTHRLLVARRGDQTLKPVHPDSGFSSLAALFYVALFRTLRRALATMQGSNPTWLRKPAPSDRRLRVERRTIARHFRQECENLKDRIMATDLSFAGECPASIQVGASEATELQANSVDSIISSPPYCTRIDYVVATQAELALLGMTSAYVRTLREDMLGTTLMRGEELNDDSLGSPTAVKFIAAVRSHGSHGAARYYAPFYGQYFDSMRRSIAELDRVARPASPVALVVQDSFFKSRRVDLATIIGEMARSNGWDLERRFHYRVRTRAAQNPRSRRYGRRGYATETMLVLRTN